MQVATLGITVDSGAVADEECGHKGTVATQGKLPQTLQQLPGWIHHVSTKGQPSTHCCL